MSHESLDQPVVPSWTPSDSSRRWLLIGVFMLTADFVLSVLSTALEFRYWDQDGFTPNVMLSYVAILPQMIVLLSYLVLARDAGARGLWKSVAGMMGAYLLTCVLSLTFLDVLPAAGSTAVLVATVLGLLALAIFSFSGLPRFGDEADVPESPTKSIAPTAPAQYGWLRYVGIIVGYLVLRSAAKSLSRFVGADQFGVDDWVVIGFLALLVFGLSFTIWFAVAKIRLRATLGNMACACGVIEIAILLVHAGLAAAIFAVIIAESATSPELDDEAIELLLDPWMKRGTVVSAGCHVVWIAATAMFFLSVRNRPRVSPPEIADI